MKGFKPTGNGPKYGRPSFSAKAGFTGSTGKRQEVRGYSRSIPSKHKFAAGGMVVTKGTDGGSALTRRTKPVTGFDAEAGGKSPLRPGFNKGGKACYAEGGKVSNIKAAAKMMEALMRTGNTKEQAAVKAAKRYGLMPGEMKPSSPAPTGGGGMPAEKQMLAKGGIAQAVSRSVGRAASQLPIKAPPSASAGGPPDVKTPRTPISGYGSFRRGPVFGSR